MALTPINTLKNWFKTNLIPTQQQFWDMLDSFRHKSDKVAATDVDGLSNLLAAKASASVFQAHTTADNAHAALFGELREEIDAKLVDSIAIGDPTAVIVPTGNVHCLGVGPGTYAFWGGLTVPDNNIATLKRVGGLFSMSLTTFDLSGKVNVSDIIDDLDSTETNKPGSANSVRLVAEKVNEVYNSISNFSAISGTPESVDGYYDDSGFIPIGGYKSAKYDITGVIGDLFISTRTATAPFLAMAKYYDASNVLISSQGSWVSGGIVTHTRELCIIPAGTKYIGITNHYSGFSDPAFGILEESIFNPVKQSDINPLIANDEAILNSENLFIYNKFLEPFATEALDYVFTKTSFSFGGGILSQTITDAISLFKYKGNYLSLVLGDINNGGLVIMKSDYENFESYTNTLEGNWEIYSPVAVTGFLRIFQGTAGSYVQKGVDTPFSFIAGVNIVSIPKTTMDSDYDVAWLRLFPTSAWNNQTIGFGRLLLSGKTVKANQLDANINELQANVFKQSQKEQASHSSYWAGKKMVYIGDSVAYANNIQPEIVRTTGLIYSNVENQTGTGGHKAMGIGSSRIIPLINNTYVGQQVGNSIYERADDVKFYNPNLIVLAGGQNDINNTGTVLGNISDAPYTGGAVTSSPPTFISAYKGTLEKLILQNPTARIICVTPLWSSGAFYADKKPFCDAIVEIAKMNGCLCVNLLEESGVNILNHNDYVPDGVHPNDFSGEIIGSIISKNL